MPEYNVEQSGYFIRPPLPGLYGTLYQPKAPPRGAVLLLAAFGEERKCVVRTLVLTARALAAEGVAVLRLDSSGAGDSQGAHGEATLRQWTREAAAALEELRKLAPGRPAAVLGVRLGANLALRTARESVAAGAILVEPILRGADYLRDLRRRKQIKEMMARGKARTTPEEIDAAWNAGRPVDFDGFEIGPDLAAELRRLDLAAELAEAPESCRIQVLRVGGMKELPRDWKAAAGSLRERPGCEVRIVRAKPFWGQIEYYEPEPVLNAVNAYCAEIFRE